LAPVRLHLHLPLPPQRLEQHSLLFSQSEFSFLQPARAFWAPTAPSRAASAAPAPPLTTVRRGASHDDRLFVISSNLA
jgi:hypothetical protein